MQNAINPLNQSQCTIPRIVNSNGGALTPGILVFLIYFALFDQQTNKKMNTFDGIDEPVVDSAVGKKRKPSKSNHLREEIKKMRHAGGREMPTVACSHTTASNLCRMLTREPQGIF